jgi:hypothetical protein
MVETALSDSIREQLAKRQNRKKQDIVKDFS